MDYQNHNTESRENKHLNMRERMIVEIRLKDGFSAYKIAKELNRSINTVLKEIRRGTTKQIKQGKEFMCILQIQKNPHNLLGYLDKITLNQI